MEDINSNILHASVGHLVSAESPLTGWPAEIPAYYSEVKPEDLREGMEGIIHITHSHAKTRGRYDSEVTSEFGTIMAVDYKQEDADNMYVSITHRFPTDIEETNSARQYNVFMNTTNWESRGKFYQRHRWLRMSNELIPAVPHEGIKDLILRIDHWDGETNMSIVMDSINEDTWIDIQDKFALDVKSNAMYHLYPKPAKVLRQAEAIPPMPGEKPQPGDNQPGEGGQGEPTPGEPDIPPMPGESRQSVDENKRGETTELAEGWWGTGTGEK